MLMLTSCRLKRMLLLRQSEEIATNYLSLIRLTEQLLPVSEQNKRKLRSSMCLLLSFSLQRRPIPTYSATQGSRAFLYAVFTACPGEDTNIKVFELMPPLVNTDFSKEVGGENGIPPLAVAEDLFPALKKDEYEIRVGRPNRSISSFCHLRKIAFKRFKSVRNLLANNAAGGSILHLYLPRHCLLCPDVTCPLFCRSISVIQDNRSGSSCALFFPENLWRLWRNKSW